MFIRSEPEQSNSGLLILWYLVLTLGFYQSSIKKSNNKNDHKNFKRRMFGLKDHVPRARIPLYKYKIVARKVLDRCCLTAM